MRVVALVSGGMDSVAALYHAHREHEVAGALSFDYGSKHNHREIPFGLPAPSSGCSATPRLAESFTLTRLLIVSSRSSAARNRSAMIVAIFVSVTSLSSTANSSPP